MLIGHPSFNYALGTKVVQMAGVHQTTLLPGRMPDRLIGGEFCKVPGWYFRELK